MLINVNQKIVDFEGNIIKRRQPTSQPDEKPKAPKPLTLKMVCVDALLATYPNEPQLSGEDKLKYYRLAELIDKGGKNEDGMVGMSAETIVLLKKAIAKLWGTLVSGQAWIMLEKEEEKQKIQTQKKKDETQETKGVKKEEES